MQIKKRYIKEEIDRLERILQDYYLQDQNSWRTDIARIEGRIDGLSWVLDFN